MQPNYPQQGYGAPQQPYGEPERVRANAGAAALAGILGILAAGALAWVVIEYFASGGTDTWQAETWTVVIVRAVLGLLILVLALFTLGRKVGAAWGLFLMALLGAATILLEPILAGEFGGWFELLFEFSDSGSIGIVAASGLSLLTAIFALFAGALKSGGEAQPDGF